MAEPDREWLLVDGQEPKCKKSKTNEGNPERKKLRKDTLEPTFMHCRTEVASSNRDNPRAGNGGPEQEKLRGDRKDSGCT